MPSFLEQPTRNAPTHPTSVAPTCHQASSAQCLIDSSKKAFDDKHHLPSLAGQTCPNLNEALSSCKKSKTRCLNEELVKHAKCPMKMALFCTCKFIKDKSEEAMEDIVCHPHGHMSKQ